MTHDEWLDQFADELLKIRQNLTPKFARSLAQQAYSESADPRVAAREYDKQLKAQVPAARKRGRW
jgi:hypothetical protein